MRAFTGTLATLSVLTLGATVQAQTAAGEPQRESAQSQPVETSHADQPFPNQVSQVRIVRLSQVRGAVQLDRNIGRGFEDAFANIPIVNGSKLMTAAGVAEIEFEDNSTLRLAPGTTVSFEQLGRSQTGATLSKVKVTRGTVYVSLAKSRDNLFQLQDGTATMVVSPGSHLRLEAAGPESKLAVFEGEAQVNTATGPTAVMKKQTLLLDPASGSAPTLVAKTENADYDTWDQSQAKYHTRSAGFTGSGLAPGTGTYGANDLNYYGQFSDVAGCGSVWRPYFASAAWDPYANGNLAYFQGAGYSWVSPYPWGWLPFHSGSWQQCGASGWGWRPNGQWHGLGNLQLHRNPTHLPLLPVHPAPGQPTLLQVNLNPIAPSGSSEPTSFTFRKDSAGLGVPREGFGHLSHLSSSAEQHGTASRSMTLASSNTSTVSGSLSSGSSRQSAGGSSTRGSGSSGSSSHSSFSGGSSGGGSQGSGGSGHH